MDSRPRDEVVSGIDDLLRQIFGRYLRPKAPPRQDMNVTMGQMHCLGAIGHLGSPSMSEVAAELDLHPSTVTVLVDGLVAHGLARRWVDPKDRRVVRVSETPKGRRNHQRHMAETRERVTGMLSGLSDDELARIHDSLVTLRDAARVQAEAEGPSPSQERSGCGPAGPAAGRERGRKS